MCLAKNGINIMMISTAVSEANMSQWSFAEDLLGRALSTLEIALLGRSLVSEVTAEDDICVIAVMGANMQGTLGVASKVFTTVAKQRNQHPHDRPRVFGTEHFLRRQRKRRRSSGKSHSRRIQTGQSLASLPLVFFFWELFAQSQDGFFET